MKPQSLIRTLAMTSVVLLAGQAAAQQTAPLGTPLDTPFVSHPEWSNALVSPVPGNPAPPTDALREIEDLRQRLERCEAELRSRDTARTAAESTTGIVRDSAAVRADDADAPPPTRLLNPGLAPATAAAGLGGPATVPIISSPTLQIGGKAIWDNAMFSQDPANRSLVGDEPNLTGFRFLRLMFYGDLYENINYRLEVDMAQAESSSIRRCWPPFKTCGSNFASYPF